MKAADRRRFVGVDLEHSEKLCDLQKVVNFFCEVEKFQFAAFAAHGGVSANKFADSGTVNVVHVAKIEHDFASCFVDKLPDRFAEIRAAIAERDAAARVNYGNGAGISRCQMKCHFSYASL